MDSYNIGIIIIDCVTSSLTWWKDIWDMDHVTPIVVPFMKSKKSWWHRSADNAYNGITSNYIEHNIVLWLLQDLESAWTAVFLLRFHPLKGRSNLKDQFPIKWLLSSSFVTSASIQIFLIFKLILLNFRAIS